MHFVEHHVHCRTIIELLLKKFRKVAAWVEVAACMADMVWAMEAWEVPACMIPMVCHTTVAVVAAAVAVVEATRQGQQ